MSEIKDQTEQRITRAALALFLKQGIKRTSVDEIAHAAGLTRVTIYRYFPRREQIVLAAFNHVIEPLQRARDWVEVDPEADIDAVLDSVGKELAHLPHGDLSSCMLEFRRVHPSAYETFSQARRERLRVLFEWIFSVAEQHHRLRPGLNHTIVEIYFTEMIVGFLERPMPLSPEITPAEFFTTLKNLFLYGILMEKQS